jgi:hypothetical protein
MVGKMGGFGLLKQKNSGYYQPLSQIPSTGSH